MAKPHLMRIEGYVIVSADGMLADASGIMPPELKFEALGALASMPDPRALRLYLDFLNIFIFLMQLLGNRE